MNFTRVIALSAIATVMSVVSVPAQNLRNASPPAEFPPASYTGKQYVDSRGCIYIRAGIDGNVTWVPRVSRDRKQVCGYKPTAVAGASAAPAKPRGPAPVEITVPSAATASADPAPKPLPRAVAKPAPKTAAKPRSVPAPVTVRRPAPVAAAPAPREPDPVIAPRKTPAPTGSGCSNASAFSQQFINKGPGVRCGPQAEPPVTYGRGWEKHSALGVRRQDAAALPPDTRVVPRHVYDRRRNTDDFPVPKGYRRVWSDDRLNRHRAEHSLRPAQPRDVAMVPPGYRRVVRDDDRLNPYRGAGSAGGEAQTDQIWTRTVPRTLVRQPTDRPVVTLPREVAKSPAEAERRLRLRLSTRSAPADQPALRTSAPMRYVRVATFDNDAQARQVAQALARGGLPMRLGTLNGGKAARRVVLAGPFDDAGAAEAALTKVRAAGYAGASLNQ